MFHWKTSLHPITEKYDRSRQFGNYLRNHFYVWEHIMRANVEINGLAAIYTGPVDLRFSQTLYMRIIRF